MKVLHFFKTYLPETMGGIEQVIYQLAEGGIRHGVESEVLYLSENSPMRDCVVGRHKTHRVHEDLQLASTGFSLSAFAEFRRLARQADLIHYHFPWPFMDVVHFASGINVPTVVSYHSDIVKQRLLLKLYEPLMRRFLGSVDVIVATSPNYLATSNVLKRFVDKVKVIPIGVDRDTYPQADSAALAKWQQSIGSRFFLFVGALRYYKGLDYLLDAAQENGLPVVIVGAGPLETELKAKADKLELTNVFFLGALPDEDKSALLSLCTAMVFPSHLRSEAFGVSLLEAAMFGKPLITCEIGTGTTYINIDGETGLVIPPRDSSALAVAMRVLWEDSDKSERLGAGALARYERLFRADAMIDAYHELYKSLVKNV